MSLLAGLGRRHVIRVAMLYVAWAWVFLQVADVLTDALPMPDRSMRAALAGMAQDSLEARRLQGLAILYHHMGRTAESDAALAALSGIPDVGTYLAAAVHAWRGERDAAFAALDTALAECTGAMVEFKCDPAFAALRVDPRREHLLRRVGLDDAGVALIGADGPRLRWINRPRRRSAMTETP